MHQGIPLDLIRQALAFILKEEQLLPRLGQPAHRRNLLCLGNSCEMEW